MRIHAAPIATAVLVIGVTIGRTAACHDLYLMNDNHTDYGWNASPATLDSTMAAELDYYLKEISRTRTHPAASQARFNADSWWYLYNYQHSRPPAQFQKLIDAIRSGHITVPLNPFVLLYGALPTEAAIRAGYYPGRMERRYGLRFRLAQYMENTTSPWGLASLWASSGAEFTWKGICGCATKTPYRDRRLDVFRWRGPDGKELIAKWYRFQGQRSFGGYAEARNHLSLDGIEEVIRGTQTLRPPLPAMVGLFGAGHDDVSYMTDRFPKLARVWNGSAPIGDRVFVSNGIDYFEALASNADGLPVLQGGWGNDWDLWPAALSQWTTRARDAVERLRTVELLHAVASSAGADPWRDTPFPVDAAWIDFFKYFEHSWGATSRGLLALQRADKKRWAESFESTVARTGARLTETVAGLFATGEEPRLAVFNPLGFARTDYADHPIAPLSPEGAPVRVIDIATGTEVPSQIVRKGKETVLRFLARDVPALGYREYGIERGRPATLPPAALASRNRIENGRYRVTIGPSGEIAGILDKQADRVMLAHGFSGMNAAGTAEVAAENVGPVSATVRISASGSPERSLRITLFRGIDRIEIESEIRGAVPDDLFYAFDFGMAQPDIHFEEVGAIARPGLTGRGGDFLPGTNAKYMTLNHFVNLARDGYDVTLSNRDAFAMRIGNSTERAFDLSSGRIRVLAVGNPLNVDLPDQGGATWFRHRFALSGHTGAYSSARAMRESLAHGNPLYAVALPRNGRGPFAEPLRSFASVGASNVVVLAFKRAEEAERGLVLRLWELDGRDTPIRVNVAGLDPARAFETSLIETDRGPIAVRNGRLVTTIGAHAIETLRFLPGDADGSAPSRN